ncbi:MAG: hypothetical protein LVQ64_04305 [Thermoplasmatales archaeon]|nr:hypothetical protein [Thermoplasmatales archaeon]
MKEVEISGDFFTMPFDAPLADLERGLAGQILDERSLQGSIADWLRQHHVELVGATAADLAASIVTAAELAPTTASRTP